MKTLIVIAFVAVAVLACLPDSSQALDSTQKQELTSSIERCKFRFIFDVLRNRNNKTLTEQRFCDIYNNYVICQVQAFAAVDLVLTEELETRLETQLEKTLLAQGITCDLDVDRAIAAVKR